MSDRQLAARASKWKVRLRVLTSEERSRSLIGEMCSVGSVETLKTCTMTKEAWRVRGRPAMLTCAG